MRRTLFAACALLSLAATPATACTLSMGWEEWQPYQYQQNGQLTGLDIDLVNAIAEEADCSVTFTEVPWARHLDRLAKGDLQLAAGASRTPEREGFAHFSAPYRTEAVALLTRSDAAYDDLKAMLAAGGRLGVVREYEYGDAVADLIDSTAYGALVSAVDSDSTNYKKLLAGRIDGMLLDPYAAGALKTELGGATKIAAVLTESPIHVMLSKASVEAATVERFNKALETLRSDGTYDAIVGRYTGS